MLVPSPTLFDHKMTYGLIFTGLKYKKTGYGTAKTKNVILSKLLFRAKKSVNKKVLMRERKRHTARHVASARYATLSNGWGRGGTPSSPGGRYPHHPDLVGGGVPPNHPDLGWGTPPPRPEMGYPLPRPEMGYAPT